MPDALENLCNVPVRMINGRQDPLKNGVAGNIPDLDAFALRRLAYDFRYWQMLRRGHEVVPELSNAIYLDALEHPRDPNPARVVLLGRAVPHRVRRRTPGSSSVTTPRTGSPVSACAAGRPCAATRGPSTSPRSPAPTACGSRPTTRRSTPTRR